MKIDIAFEEVIMSRCLRDTTYLKQAALLLDAHHFGTKYHSWVWKQIRDVWDRYREPTSGKILLNRAKRDFDDDDVRRPYLELARKLVKMKARTTASALEELSIFVRTVNGQLALEKAAKALEKGKLDELYEEMRTASKRDLRPRTYTHIEWIGQFEERQAERKHRREHPELYVSIPTGLKSLDKVITGIQLGELGLIVGTTGRGKSIMLNNLAYHAVTRDFDVAYFGFEMPARQIAMRQDARWLKIPYAKFKGYDFTPTELRDIDKRLAKVKDKWQNKFHIYSLPVRSADINTVRAALDDLRIDHGVKPKLIILDSADHMLPSTKQESMRIDQANVYWEVKGFAEEEGAAVWSSTQAGKEYASRTATAESPAESYDKARIADLIFSLNEPVKKSRATKVVDDDEDYDGEDEHVGEVGASVRGRYMEGFLAKYRDGASKFSIPLDAELEKMLIQEADGSEEEAA